MLLFLTIGRPDPVTKCRISTNVSSSSSSAFGGGDNGAGNDAASNSVLSRSPFRGFRVGCDSGTGNLSMLMDVC